MKTKMCLLFLFALFGVNKMFGMVKTNPLVSGSTQKIMSCAGDTINIICTIPGAVNFAWTGKLANIGNVNTIQYIPVASDSLFVTNPDGSFTVFAYGAAWNALGFQTFQLIRYSPSPVLNVLPVPTGCQNSLFPLQAKAAESQDSLYRLYVNGSILSSSKDSSTYNLSLIPANVGKKYKIEAITKNGCSSITNEVTMGVVNPLPLNQVPTINGVSTSIDRIDQRCVNNPVTVIGLQASQNGFSYQLQLFASPNTVLNTQTSTGGAITFTPQPGKRCRIVAISPQGCPLIIHK